VHNNLIHDCFINILNNILKKLSILGNQKIYILTFYFNIVYRKFISIFIHIIKRLNTIDERQLGEIRARKRVLVSVRTSGLYNSLQEQRPEIPAVREYQATIIAEYRLHPIQAQKSPQRFTAFIVFIVSTLFAHELHTKYGKGDYL
jgi:hypothetical protein